jgi:hypothetical protein
LVPSAEEATAAHELLGAVVWTHVTPESDETYIGHGPKKPYEEYALPVATNLVKSADAATALHAHPGTAADDHCWAGAGFTTLMRPPNPTTSDVETVRRIQEGIFILE